MTSQGRRPTQETFSEQVAVYAFFAIPFLVVLAYGWQRVNG